MSIPSMASSVDEVARRVATELELPPEQCDLPGLLRWANQRVATWLKQHGSSVENLEQLRSFVASQLNLIIDEVRSDEDLDRIERERGGGRDPAVARVRATLDGQTEGVLLERQVRDDWERRFLAVVDARESKAPRGYFSGWHEIAHLLTSNRQRQFEFQYRHTPVVRKDPEEVLMDIIAGDLAFYRPMVAPLLAEVVGDTGRLSFRAVEQMRTALAPSASWHSSLIGAVKAAPLPAILVRAGRGLKRDQERVVNEASLFGPSMADVFQEKLRAREATHNDASKQLKVELFPNMEVPDDSLVAKAATEGEACGIEDLGTWRTSAGPLRSFKVFIEARRVTDSTFALLTVVGDSSELQPK